MHYLCDSQSGPQRQPARRPQGRVAAVSLSFTFPIVSAEIPVQRGAGGFLC